MGSGARVRIELRSITERLHGRFGSGVPQSGLRSHLSPPPLAARSRGRNARPERAPPLGEIVAETRELGGRAIHAHGGYDQGIRVDAPRGLSDGVELLQFAVYRGIGLAGWYDILEAGLPLPVVGASDYPYCRVLGDCRTYARIEGEPSAAAWLDAAASGRSFVTTGPLLLLEVDGEEPGATVALEPGDSRELLARVRVRSEVAPVDELDLIVNGEIFTRREIPDDRRKNAWFDLETRITVREPLWIAARAFGKTQDGEPDAEAHTNPVWVTIGGERRREQGALDRLLARVKEREELHRERGLSERARTALEEHLAAARRALLRVRDESVGGTGTKNAGRPK